MQTVLIAIHLMIVVALVAVVLLQRSEGGALGVGGGSGFMTGRGQANVLTRATAILATLFFITSLGLVLIARYGHSGRLDFSAPRPGTAESAAKLPPTQPDSVLDQVRKLEQQRASGGQAAAPTGSPALPPPNAAPAASAPPSPAAQPAEPSGLPDRPSPAAPTASGPSATPAAK